VSIDEDISAGLTACGDLTGHSLTGHEDTAGSRRDKRTWRPDGVRTVSTALDRSVAGGPTRRRHHRPRSRPKDRWHL